MCRKKHRFMHELMHVWQAQHGMFVRTRGLFSRFADYSYSLDKENIRHYSLEQQASLVSDYWLLQAYGFKKIICICLHYEIMIIKNLTIHCFKKI